MSQYEKMTFAEYEFREYPKFVQTGETTDPTSKSKVATGVIVNNEAEEAEVRGTGKEPVREEDTRERLLKVAKQQGVNVDARWGVQKITDALVAAKVDVDHDPDA